MVDSNNLTDFPREGHSQNETGRKTRVKRKRMDDDLFKTRSEVKTKPKKTTTRKKKNVDDEEDDIAVIEELNVRSLPINSTCFGCIQEIREFEIKMSLPGDIQCVIPITNISESYTEALQDFADDAVNNKPPLKPKSMFRVGECYPVKIIEKREDNHTFQGAAVTRIHVIGSLDPKEIYEDVVSSTFVKCCNNLIMSAVVMSIEDHGYIMDIGIEGLKAFLSDEDSEPFLAKLNVNSLSIGQLTLCEVKSCDKRIVKLGPPSKKSKITGTDNPEFSASCLFPGVSVTATVMDVSDNGLHVMVFNEFKGFVHKNHLKTVWDLPSRDYKIAENVKGTILYRNPISKLVAVTLRKTLDPQNVTQMWSGIRVGQIIKKGTVVGKDDLGTIVLKFKGGLKAVIPKSQLSDEFLTPSEFTEYESKLEIGTNHRFRIKSISYLDGYVTGTLKPSILAKGDLSVDDIEIGAFLVGKVKRLTDQGLVLQLAYNIQGFVPTIHLAESANVPNPEKIYPLDKEVKCRVIRIDKTVDPPKISLTCKKSLMKKNLFLLDYFNKAETGLETDGVIALVNDFGLLIEFFNGVRGFAPLNLLSEAKISNPYGLFKVGQIVHCYVVSAIPTKRKMILSLIPLNSNEEISPQRKRKISASETEESSSFKKSKKIVALEQKSNQQETEEEEEEEQVLEKKNKKNKVSEAPKLKSKSEMDSIEKPKQKKENIKNKVKPEDIERDVLNTLKQLTKKAKNKGEEVNMRQQSEDDEQVSSNVEKKSKKLVEKKAEKKEKVKEGIKKTKTADTKQTASKSKECLPVNEGFIWNEEEEDNAERRDTDSSEEEEETDENKSEKKKKSRKERNEEARKREEYLRKREEILMDKDRPPETSDDFERLVVSSPNSSIVWIHYISFHLESGEIEKARTVAERALVTISFREEKEKFNIWVALLNLENEYGDQESFNAVFTRALQMNDQLKVYNHVVKIYENSKKLKEAEQMYELMCRKFKKNKQVYISFAIFLMRHNESAKSRNLLEKALRSIETREHIDVISKFAQIEFQFGEFERGKTMFENLISNYPKRVDLWSIFVDMMIKYSLDSSEETVASIRSVFERAITLKLPVKKMRTMFRKYLEFETKYGNDNTVARIKQKAKEYVEETPFAADD